MGGGGVERTETDDQSWERGEENHGLPSPLSLSRSRLFRPCSTPAEAINAWRPAALRPSPSPRRPTAEEVWFLSAVDRLGDLLEDFPLTYR